MYDSILVPAAPRPCPHVLALAFRIAQCDLRPGWSHENIDRGLRPATSDQVDDDVLSETPDSSHNTKRLPTTFRPRRRRKPIGSLSQHKAFADADGNRLPIAVATTRDQVPSASPLTDRSFVEPIGSRARVMTSHRSTLSVVMLVLAPSHRIVTLVCSQEPRSV